MSNGVPLSISLKILMGWVVTLPAPAPEPAEPGDGSTTEKLKPSAGVLFDGTSFLVLLEG
jgi:hypothetical protein